jgi:hypothetical protein
VCVVREPVGEHFERRPVAASSTTSRSPQRDAAQPIASNSARVACVGRSPHPRPSTIDAGER